MELQKNEKKEQEVRKDVGFVERRNNSQYNIVYRNKTVKPLTVNELFGFEKKENNKVEEIKNKKFLYKKNDYFLFFLLLVTSLKSANLSSSILSSSGWT